MKKNNLYYFLKRVYYRIVQTVPDKMYAQITYYKCYRKFLDLSNPKTFDEKLWWLKFNYFNPLMRICTDKYEVRKYVEQCGLKDILNECYAHFNSVEEIDLNEIPIDDFFLKVNNTSGGNMICHKNTFNKKEIHSIFDHLLKDQFYLYGREYNYKNIKPCIIVEKILCPKNGEGLLDYKFMCFDGIPKLLFLDIGVCNADGTHAEKYYRNIYDMNFKPLAIKETREHYKLNEIQKPENYDFMIECCRKLSKPFPHCRVDLYNIDGKVYFGEITFFHGSGCNKIEPHEADLEIGSWIRMDHSYPNKY
jgi:hypothetical protein